MYPQVVVVVRVQTSQRDGPRCATRGGRLARELRRRLALRVELTSNRHVDPT